MSENVIPVGNTPIFERLVRDMQLRGIRFESLLSGNTPGLKPVPAPEKPWMAPGAWMFRPVPRMSEETVQTPLVEDNVSVKDLESGDIKLEDHIAGMVEKFEERFPEAHPIHITRIDELDGTITLKVTKGELVEQTDEDVNAAPKPLSVLNILGEPKEHHEYFHVSGEAKTMPPVIQTTFSIGEDEPDVLYMKTSTWGSDEE